MRIICLAICLQSFAACTSTITKYKNWTKYTDGCIYRSISLLKENGSEGIHMIDVWKGLTERADCNV